MNPNHDPKHSAAPLGSSANPQTAPEQEKLKELFDGLQHLRGRWEKCSFGDVLASFVLTDTTAQIECRREILISAGFAYQWAGDASRNLDRACFGLSPAQTVNPMKSIDSVLDYTIAKFERFNFERRLENPEALIAALDDGVCSNDVPTPLNRAVIEALRDKHLDLASYSDPEQVEASTCYNTEIIARLKVFSTALKAKIATTIQAAS